ncbi:hypothetical protein C2E20_1618 [Micractinium conductrix]|uniref:Response regulatory domain-containing protein n=1 Tax=Micractinium conductrix TaxID=554055 RepID=A0A2P6VMX8_9CHLO|nr:hypothetical protein C2E20_1618 [Micractinium conductrix]|eukprot:PSC75444.1 hypothetical protein C2E20_1618 [Micractinium conductrix]
MSECGSTQDVLRAVHLGAADFLDKPLSLLKLKNIWQHSVRKMMLKAAGPRRSPVPMAGMAPAPVATLPMVLPFHQGGALPLPPWTAMAATKPAPASTASPSLTSSPSLSLLELESMGPESPATPSALSDDFHDTFSCMSGADSGSPSLRTSLDEPSDSFVEALNSALCTSPPLPRPTSVTSLPTVVPAAAAPAPAAPAQWPALTPGCVWGTPANGPVPPPLPCSVAAAATPSWAGLSPAPPAPVLIKPGGAAPAPAAPVLPLAAAAEVAPSMDFLLSDLLAPKPGAAPGPLGLKLRKSSSLLNLINSTLSTDAPTACGPTPMVCC